MLAMNSPESHQKTVGHKVKIYAKRKDENKKKPQNFLEKKSCFITSHQKP
jgi:hypothetical protein